MSMWLMFSLHIWQEYQNVFNTQHSTSLKTYSLQSGWRVCDILSHLPDVIFLLLLSFGLSYVQLFVTPWTVACQAPLSSTISWNLLKFMFIESVMLSNHLLPLTIPCRPLLLLHSTFPSIRVFSNESALCIGGQSIGASASVLPVNIQGWFPLGVTGLISLLSRGLSRVFSRTTIQKHQLFHAQSSLRFNSHICTWLQKNHSFE